MNILVGAMMNIVALAMLLSSLGSAMLLSPEPMLVRSPEDGESPLQAVKEAAQGTYLKAEETAEAAKETIVEGVTRPLEKGLGWFRRKPPSPEDRLAAAREKAAEAREAFEEASAQLRDAAVGKAVDTGMYVGDKSSQAVGTAKDAAGAAEGWVEKGAHAAYNKAADVKDGAYNAAAAVGHKVGSAFRTAKESVEDTSDSAAETLGSAKEKAHDKVVDAKDKVYEGAENVHDAVIEDVHLGVDNSKGTATDAAEKVEQAVHETKETGQGILGKVKDAACYTAECIRARAQEAGSYLPLVGQGVGYVHKDAPAESVKDKAAETARQAKDTAGEYFEDGRDWVEDRYDSAREYHDEAGRRYRRAREYYHDVPSDYYRGRRGRNAASRYYDAAKDEAEDFYDHGIKDRARYLRDRAGDYYDDVRGYLPGRSRDYYGRRGHDWGEDYYRRSRIDDLNEVVESMGWERVGKVPKDHVSVSSPKEVVIGDVKYAWPQGRGQPPSDELHETVFHHMTNSVKGAAHTVGEKLGFVKEKAKYSGVRAKDQAYDTARRSWSEHDDDDEEEDSIVARGARNLKDGVRSAGQAYEEQRSKAGEYADEARQELSNFAGYREDDKGSDHRRRSWKDVLIRKPVGFLLTLTRALHLFTFSTVYGSSFWVTFVSGLILSKHVPRQQFGYVQSRMFPVYYRIMAVGQSVLLLLHSLLHPWFSAEGVERTQLLNFALMIASTLINAYYLEPKATKVMFERLKVEKEEGRGLENTANPLDAKQVMEDQKKKLNSINQQFKTLHGYSSAANLISLGGLTCHLWHLANRLVI